MAGRGGRRPATDAMQPTEPLVACVDGPMQGQWYYEREWAARVESAAYMVARGQRRTACLDYGRGTKRVPHPSGVGDGLALHYQPKENV